MTRALILLAAFLTLAVPAALAALPAGKGKPEQTVASSSPSAEQNVAKKCKAERTLGADAFKAKYGSKGIGKCVAATSTKQKDDESGDDEKAEDNAAKKCKAERTQLGVDAFKAKYGTNANKANAFGKCVSKLAKAQSA